MTSQQTGPTDVRPNTLRDQTVPNTFRSQIGPDPADRRGLNSGGGREMLPGRRVRPRIPGWVLLTAAVLAILIIGSLLNGTGS